MKSWRGGGWAVNKPKTSVVFAALLLITLLAVSVCALHWVNAVSLRGVVKLADYRLTDGKEENLVAVVDDPYIQQEVLHISGALMRMNQPVGEVNVRVGLIAQRLEKGMPVQDDEEAILINTQMVRRYELAREYDCDDHCGFHAAVTTKQLIGGNVQYRVVLVDETDGAMRMVETGMTITLIEGGIAFARVNGPGEEQYAQKAE